MPTPPVDSTSTDDADRNPVDVLAEEFTQRLRNGETPSIDEYVARLPDHEPVIRAMFPSIAMVERVERQERNDRTRSRQQQARLAVETIGDFRIVREIGRGGMGIVYEATQQSLNRRVALKVLNAGIASSANQLQRFAREAEAAARLHHTNIVTVHGIGEEDGLHYFAMQLIDGIPLNRIIARTRQSGDVPTEQTALAGDSGWGRTTGLDASRSESGDKVSEPLPTGPATIDASGRETAFSRDTSISDSQTEIPAAAFETDRPLPAALDYFRTVARIGWQVAEALSYAHEHGVLHRDIKPSNLLLDREGTVWVTDFGLARQEDREGITNTGDILGTIRYMAPEQFNGDGDVRSDLCSLGLTLFELLTLRPAYLETKHAALIRAKTDSSPPHARAINPAIPSDLETIVLKTCSTDPAHRYQTAAELAEDLHRFLEDRPILARRITPLERLWRWSRRNPTTALLSTALLILLIALSVVFAVGNYQTQQALTAVQREYDRAEDNLRLRSQALDEATKQSRRAETNLALAIQAFEQIMRNIGSRGAVQSLTMAPGEGQIAHPDSAVTPADAEMLGTLLQFFDRFARENQADLTAATASAIQRVGDIQQRLGRLAEADGSHQRALDTCAELLKEDPNNISLVVQQARILNTMAITASLDGQMHVATKRSNDARQRLERSSSVLQSREGRFELARTLILFSSMGSRFGPGSLFPESGTKPSQAQLAAVRSATQRALDLLEELNREDSANPDYRLTIARTYRQQNRLARMDQDATLARRSLETAIVHLQSLTDEFPESPAYRSELAETLCTPLQIDDAEESQRIDRAVALCVELNSTWPNIPEYLAIQGHALNRQSATKHRLREFIPAYNAALEALEVHSLLCRRFPEVAAYQISLGESLRQLAEIEVTQKRHVDALAHLDEALLYLRDFRERHPGPGYVVEFIRQLESRRAEIEQTEKQPDDSNEA